MNSPQAAAQAVESFSGYDLEGREMQIKLDRKGY
jgi:hypothetical protein